MNVPDDRVRRASVWQAVASPAGAPLRERLADGAAPTPALLGQMRRKWPREEIEVALELRDARVRAAGKFPDHPALLCDRQGLEQASSQCVADWKALRFKRAGAQAVLDLCCGIGGDAMSLAKHFDVLAVDHDEVRAWMTKENAGCVVACADVAAVGSDHEWVHIDPARRDEATGRRRWQLDALEPSLAFVLERLARSTGGACKLGPGVEIPIPNAPEGTEVEIIQEHNTLVQAVMWTGALAGCAARATLLPSGHSIGGQPIATPFASAKPEAGQFLIEPCDAIERAGLIGLALQEGNFSAGVMAPGLGLLLADAPITSPWLKSWPILAVLPMRERQVKRWLAENDGGELLARTRGNAIDVDAFSKRLSRSQGRTKHVMFGLRIGKEARAVLVGPAVNQPAAE